MEEGAFGAECVQGEAVGESKFDDVGKMMENGGGQEAGQDVDVVLDQDPGSLVLFGCGHETPGDVPAVGEVCAGE